jgi:hypothetical protein
VCAWRGQVIDAVIAEITRLQRRREFHLQSFVTQLVWGRVAAGDAEGGERQDERRRPSLRLLWKLHVICAPSLQRFLQVNTFSLSLSLSLSLSPSSEDPLFRSPSPPHAIASPPLYATVLVSPLVLSSRDMMVGDQPSHSR